MARYFTLEQAEGILPDVETALREALSYREKYQQIEKELQGIIERITMAGGAHVNQEHVSQLRTSKDAIVQLLKTRLEEIQEAGCLIKDLDIGLLDFPTLYHGEEVYLCWRLGESSITFWHGTNEGFRGRKPIDQEFRDNHRAE